MLFSTHILTGANSFVIETCHEAEAHARHASRAKIKVDDFQFALRHDSKKLGRVQELLDMDREIAKKRRAFDVDEGKVRKEAADAKSKGASVPGPGRGRGRKKARVEVGEEDVDVDVDVEDGDGADGASGVTAIKTED
jgi:transcription initiation factor TFIID subunit 13